MNDWTQIKTYTEANENLKKYLEMTDTFMSLYALKRIDELEKRFLIMKSEEIQNVNFKIQIASEMSRTELIDRLCEYHEKIKELEKEVELLKTLNSKL